MSHLEILRNANQLSYKAIGSIKYKLKCIRPINIFIGLSLIVMAILNSSRNRIAVRDLKIRIHFNVVYSILNYFFS